MRNWLEKNRPWLSFIPGFDLERVWIDALHCLDLGVYQCMVPSVLIELCEEGVWPGNTRADCFNFVYEDYKSWCQQCKETPAHRFKDSKYCKAGHYPEMTQQLARGHQTRMMVFWLHSVVKRPNVSTGPHGQLRLAMLESFYKLEVIFSDHNRFIPPAAVEALSDAVESGLLCYNARAIEAVAMGRLLYVVNPRTVSCYGDEDMLGKIKRLMSRAHGSTAGTCSVLRYALRYVVLPKFHMPHDQACKSAHGLLLWR